MDTDSFLLNFEGVDVYKEMKTGLISQHMDFSNFPVDHELYDDTRKGQLGLLKSETAERPIVEAICLAPKCYSILQDNGKVKNTAKGVPHAMKQVNLTHDIYREILDGKINSVSVPYGRIESMHNKLFTVCNDKRALTGLDKKRYWLNSVESVAFDHPSIKRKHDDDDVPSTKRMKVA